MNYKVIDDESALKDFIDWLPDLAEDEVYYVCLLSRKKYDANSDNVQLKRFTSTKHDLIKKIRQLEIEVGCYVDKNDNPVSQESLALYITVNPRSQIKAARLMLVDLAKMVPLKYNGYNIHQMALSNIQKSRSTTWWIDFDFDYFSCETEWSETVSEMPQLQEPPFDNMSMRSRYEYYIIGKVLEFLTDDRGFIHPYKHIVRFLRTRCGLHVLVNPVFVKDKFKKTYYRNISSLIGCDKTGDNMIPVPGCVQGEYVPRFWS